MRLWIVVALAAVLGFVIYQNQGVQAPAVSAATPMSPSIPPPPAPAPVAKKKKAIRSQPVVEQQEDVEEAQMEDQPVEETPAPEQADVQAQQQLPEALKFNPPETRPADHTEYSLRSSETIRPDVNHPLITLTYGRNMTIENRDVSTKARSGFLADGD